MSGHSRGTEIRAVTGGKSQCEQNPVRGHQRLHSVGLAGEPVLREWQEELGLYKLRYLFNKCVARCWCLGRQKFPLHVQQEQMRSAKPLNFGESL